MKQTDKALKQTVFTRIAFELYNNIKDKEQFGIERMSRIKNIIDRNHKETRKLYLAIQKRQQDKAVFDYLRHSMHRLTLLLKNTIIPAPHIIQKMIDVGRKNETEVYEFLNKSMNKYGHIENIHMQDDDDTYIALIQTLGALGENTDNMLVKPTDVDIIKNNPMPDLANICGLLEMYKVNKLATIRFINKKLRSYDKPIKIQKQTT